MRCGCRSKPSSCCFLCLKDWCVALGQSSCGAQADEVGHDGSVGGVVCDEESSGVLSWSEAGVSERLQEMGAELELKNRNLQTKCFVGHKRHPATRLVVAGTGVCLNGVEERSRRV